MFQIWLWDFHPFYSRLSIGSITNYWNNTSSFATRVSIHSLLLYQNQPEPPLHHIQADLNIAQCKVRLEWNWSHITWNGANSKFYTRAGLVRELWVFIIRVCYKIYIKCPSALNVRNLLTYIMSPSGWCWCCSDKLSRYLNILPAIKHHLKLPARGATCNELL